jgi:hypothetical protein
MTYDNNVPLGNQTVAFTTDLIRNNFAFIQDAIGQEHNFNPLVATETYHLKASMPNLASDPPLPTGTHGVYYVASGNARFIANDGQKYKLSGASLGADGYQWLGRILLQWGVKNNPGSSGSVLFTAAFTTVYSIQLTLNRSSGNQSVVINSSVPISGSGFSYLSSSSGSDDLYWLAIGTSAIS